MKYFISLIFFFSLNSIANDLPPQSETTKEGILCFDENAYTFSDIEEPQVFKGKTVAERVSWKDSNQENVTHHRTTGQVFSQDTETGEYVLQSTYEATRRTETIKMDNSTIREFSEITSKATLADEDMRYDNDKNSKTQFQKITTEYSVDLTGKKTVVRKWIDGNPVEVSSTDFEIETEEGVKFSSSFSDKPQEYIYGESTTTVLWTKHLCKTTQL